jgi:ectoine hydroxylase-related dioxygenase (phytanoyl-CoA dioxygenase family)
VTWKHRVQESDLVWVGVGSHTVIQPLVKEQLEEQHRAGIFSNEVGRKPDIGLGHQLIARAGDVVLCHQKLAHHGGVNGSDKIRYQVYFRVHHVDHQKYVESGAVLDNLWLEFEGLELGV